MDERSLTVTDSDVGSYIQKIGESLKNYGGGNYDSDRFLRGALLSILDKPDLKNCISTASGKLSLFNALRYAASTGLSLNPQEGKAALIIYKDKVSYQIMKNGMVELAIQSGKIKNVTADIVKTNDVFSIERKAGGDRYSFKPALFDRGVPIGYFSAVQFIDGTVFVNWMTRQEVEEHRDKYSAMYKFKKEKSPWTQSFDGMAIKTVIKKMMRNLFISNELQIAVSLDDQTEAEAIEIETKGVTSDEIMIELPSPAADVPDAVALIKPEPVQPEKENPPLELVPEPEPEQKPESNEIDEAFKDLF